MQKLTLLSALFSTVLAGPVDFAKRQSSDVWQPQIGAKWQIILSQTPNIAGGIQPADAKIWDLDLFNTPQSTIASLKSAGYSVICYYSAGTSEQGRPDLGSLPQSAIGAGLPDWPGENWLDVRNDAVVQVMKSRIQLAAQKGCDAIDPDNMDGYSNQNGGGFSQPLTQSDAVTYLRTQATEAAKYGMGIGIKNAQAILPQVVNDVQFAVNEQCSEYSECGEYSALTSAGKPVLHIEYNGLKQAACISGFDTVFKNLSLDGYVQYCDGSSSTTPTTGSGTSD